MDPCRTQAVLGRSSNSADFVFFFIRQRLYLIVSMLVSFGSVPQNALATGCMCLHTRVISVPTECPGPWLHVVAHICNLSAKEMEGGGL